MGGNASSPLPGGSYGYHVLRVQEGSPGHKAGLEAFFDFIISIGNVRLEVDTDAVKEILQTNKDKTVCLVVYSSKAQSYRDVFITPTDSWGGQGLLGISIRYCSFDGANNNVWHILSVEPNSPASIAGLIANTDYIIGSDINLNNENDFYDLVERYADKSLLLYVYNSELDSCREVRITPDSKRKNGGLLGCETGYGLLHRIPPKFFPNMPPTNSAVQEADHLQSLTNTKAAVGAAVEVSVPAPNVTASPMSTYPGIPPVENSTGPPAYSLSDRLAPVVTPASIPTTQPTAAAVFGVSDLPPPAPLPPGLFVPTYPSGYQASHQAGHPPTQPADTGLHQAPYFVMPAPTTSPAMVQHSPFAGPPPVTTSAVMSGLPQSPPQLNTGHPLAPKETMFVSSSVPAPGLPPSSTATAVIAMPGMPPLDVSMPSLAELHIN